MVFSTTLKLAFQSLSHQRTRTLLTMSAISIGIAAVIVIMAAGRGVSSFILGQLDVYQPNTLSIEVKVPNGKKGSNSSGSTGIIITTLKDKDLETVRKQPNIAAAYGMVTGQELVSYQGQIKKTLLMGYGYSMPEIEKFSLSHGRFFTKEEEDSLSQVAVLGATVREQLFGDSDPTGQTIYIRGKSFRVVGSIAKRGAAFFLDMDNLIILPTKTMQRRLLGIDYFTNIIAKINNQQLALSTVNDLSELIRENHTITDPLHDDFTINTMAEAADTIGTITSGITLLLVALVCISLVVGGVGIMNIMYVSVAERTFEIGLRKALGATPNNIMWQFLSEALLLTVSGGIAGVIIGALVALLVYFLAISFGIKWIYAVPVSSVFLSVGFSMFIGVVFGLYPAKTAAALNPIEALRKE